MIAGRSAAQVHFFDRRDAERERKTRNRNEGVGKNQREKRIIDVEKENDRESDKIQKERRKIEKTEEKDRNCQKLRDRRRAEKPLGGVQRLGGQEYFFFAIMFLAFYEMVFCATKKTKTLKLKPIDLKHFFFQILKGHLFSVSATQKKF